MYFFLSPVCLQTTYENKIYNDNNNTYITFKNINHPSPSSKHQRVYMNSNHFVKLLLTPLTTNATPLPPFLPPSATLVPTQCTPYTRNCRVIITPTTKQTNKTPCGHASNATTARKVMSESDEMNMHNAGTRAESAKKK